MGRSSAETSSSSYIIITALYSDKVLTKIKRHLLFAAEANFKFCPFFKNDKQGMVFYENRLLTVDSDENIIPYFFENYKRCRKICQRNYDLIS